MSIVVGNVSASCAGQAVMVGEKARCVCESCTVGVTEILGRGKNQEICLSAVVDLDFEEMRWMEVDMRILWMARERRPAEKSAIAVSVAMSKTGEAGRELLVIPVVIAIAMERSQAANTLISLEEEPVILYPSEIRVLSVCRRLQATGESHWV
jgi:hypothetical protein